MEIVDFSPEKLHLSQDKLDLLENKLAKAISAYDYDGKCYVGSTDYFNRITLHIVDTADESLGIIEYSWKQLRKVTIKDIALDLSVITGIRSSKHKQLLQQVFDHFIEHGEWPNSREMSVKVKGLGNYYKLAAEIGPDYLRAGEEHVAGATSRLTVKGIALCKGFEDDLQTFLQVLKIFIERYNENPVDPKVEMLDLENSSQLSLDQVDKVSLLIQEEAHLWTGAGSSQGKNFTFTVAPSILEFEKVEKIQDYLRVQESFRGSDEPITLPYETIELAEGGIVVTPSLTETDFDYDLFISYSSRDREKANKIDEKAKKVGLKPFLAPKNIKGGEIGIEKIKEAIRKSAEVVVLVSKNSLASGWVFAEWGAAWILNKHITPLLYRCDVDEIPDLLKQPQHMDLDELDEYLQQVLERKNAP